MSDASGRLKRDKRAARRTVLAVRDGLSEQERVARSAAITDRLLALPEVAGARTVMAFWSFGSEVDTMGLIDRLFADERTVALPRIEAGDVVPVAYRRGDAVTATTFGAMEPASGAVLGPEELDLVVVPGVVFDRAGNRVGYGAGYYDRLLARVRPGAHAVAIAFGLQVLERVPSGGTDRRVHVIVTEDEVIRPGSSEGPRSGEVERPVKPWDDARPR